MSRFDLLAATLLNILDGAYDSDVLLLPRMRHEPEFDEAVCCAVCELTKMTRETWKRLAPLERIPWLETAIGTARTMKQPTDSAKERRGKPGRRGYPLKALNYAKKLRKKHPDMKAHTIRQKCLQRFPETDLPPNADSFRRWLNRPRANRAN
jgi:hypothetical protein